LRIEVRGVMLHRARAFDTQARHRREYRAYAKTRIVDFATSMTTGFQQRRLMKGRAMSRVISILAFTAALSCAAAVVAAATMEAPAGGMQPGASGAPAATGASGVTPADPPATPSTIPPGAGVYIIPGAILIGIGAALAGGTGNEPAPFPSGSGTTGTL
jgi:hypothetical protein